MSKITEGEIMCKLWDMANELYGFANENFIEEWGIDRFAITFPDAFCEHMEMIIEDSEIEDALSKFVNICKFKLNNAKKYQKADALAQAEENEAQYQVKCPDCGIRLSIDTPIMCWTGETIFGAEREETLCSECYWDNEWYESDKNEDNQEEIEERQGGLEWLEETS